MICPFLNSFLLVFFLGYGLLFSFLLLPVKPVSSSITCKKVAMQKMISALEDALEKVKTRLKVADYSTTPASLSSVTNTSNISTYISQHCKLYESFKD